MNLVSGFGSNSKTVVVVTYCDFGFTDLNSNYCKWESDENSIARTIHTQKLDTGELIQNQRMVWNAKIWKRTSFISSLMQSVKAIIFVENSTKNKKTIPNMYASSHKTAR